MYIQQIWRYPVKSMAGEPLQSASLTSSGIEGDRIVQVRNAQGRTVTARTHPGLLAFKATLGADGNPLVNGLPWTHRDVLAAVQEVVGPGARLTYDKSPERFDILPLLVATDGAIHAFGLDGRRLRPNIVIGDVEGLEERGWEGGRIHVGDVVIAVHDLRGRCIVTTFDPDTLEHEPKILRDIVKRFGGKLALNCSVVGPGEITVGQQLQVIPHRDLSDRTPELR